MASPPASSGVIAFPQPSRQRSAPSRGAVPPMRKGVLRGAMARRLADLPALCATGMPERGDRSDGSVSPLC